MRLTCISIGTFHHHDGFVCENGMRFYFNQDGEKCDEGIEYSGVDEALRDATDAALAIVREQLSQEEQHFTLDVSSDEGAVGSVTVTVSVKRLAG